MFSAFRHFAHQGHIIVEEIAAAVGLGGYLLQEDGTSKITLEDGSGFLLLE